MSPAEVPAVVVELLRSPSWAPGGSALELGCGNGGVTHALAGRFPLTVGLGVTSASLLPARRRAGGKDFVAFVTSRGLPLPFRDASFSLVFDRGSLFSESDRASPGFRAEMQRLLAPGGVYVDGGPGPVPTVGTFRKEPRDRPRPSAPLDFMGLHEMVDLSSWPAIPRFDPVRVTRRVDRRPALRSPGTVQPAALTHLGQEELVFGVGSDGDRRFYPASLLKRFLVVNDRLGEALMVMAFCGRCVSGTAYESTVDGAPLTFRVFGGHQGTMVMHDDQTGSLWSPVTGKALAGPHAGRTLTWIPVEATTMGAWTARFPDSRAPEEARWIPRWRPVEDPIREWQRRTTTWWDERLEPRTRVLGIVVGGCARAYAMAPSRPGPRVHEDEVGGVPVVLLAAPGSWPLAFDRRSDRGVLRFHEHAGRILDASGSTWANGRAAEGPRQGAVLTPNPSVLTQWHAWAAHHPDSDVARP